MQDSGQPWVSSSYPPYVLDSLFFVSFAKDTDLAVHSDHCKTDI